jgi:2-methylcitrate dehydratase PrpD
LGEPLEYKAKPRNVVDAQFSLAWGVSTALVYGAVGLNDYTDSSIIKPDILKMAAKVNVTYDPVLDSTGLEPAHVIVTLASGQTYESHVEIATGSPENPLTFDDCERKFRDCVDSAERKLPAANIEKIIGYIRDLDKQTDVRDLIKLVVWE